MNSSSTKTSVFKILAIDGGGFRGVYPAHILARIEEEWSIKWTEEFHMIAGTSTGSIIAAGLACGITAKEIVEFYAKHGAKIFQRMPFRKFGLLASRYSNAGLKTILEKVFGERKLGDLTFPLIIPTTDIGNGCVHVLKSSYDVSFVRDKNVPISEAVLASCSAPTYFDPHCVAEYSLADGGLWANNPSLVAAIDAKKRLKVPLENIRVFSLGTGKSKQFYPLKQSRAFKFFGWGFATRWKNNRFINMLMNLQAETAGNMLRLLLDDSQIMRVSFESDGVLPLDDVREYDDLKSKADRDFTHKAERIRKFIEQ